MSTVTYIRPADKGITYPFLSGNDDWFIVSRKVRAFSRQSLSAIGQRGLDYAALVETATDIGTSGFVPTLVWVSERSVKTLYSRQTTADFLQDRGLQFSLEHGPAVLSKRISRILRPFRHARFFVPDDIRIAFEDLDESLYDGLGLVSRGFLKEHFPKLAEYGRFEVTLLHDGGQEKGHCIVDDQIGDVDFIFPISGRKTEVSLVGAVFVGLEPVKGKRFMRLDPQSLINFYPFFSAAELMPWLEQESQVFLDAIKSGAYDEALGRLEVFEDEAALLAWRGWWLGEYLASGGVLSWFPGTVSAFGRQQSRRIEHSRDRDRYPIPGYRLYIAPDVLNYKRTSPGCARIDWQNATCWVNSSDWKKWAGILGGADSDDAVWVFPFKDALLGRRLLVWRSPNQLGEYLLLAPDPHSAEVAAWPSMDADKLPARIDMVAYEYGELRAFPARPVVSYSCAAMLPALLQVVNNRGVLGGYCNILLSLKAMHGRLPLLLPARLEDVIDATVKAPRDLRPVRKWIERARKELLRSAAALPASVLRRLNSERPSSPDHWLSELFALGSDHLLDFDARLAELMAQATPPMAILKHGQAWIAYGAPLRKAWARGVGSRLPRDIVVKSLYDMLLSFGGDLARWVMLGAAAGALQEVDRTDSFMWQQTPDHSTADITIQALRAIGLLGEPVWTMAGAQLWYEERPSTGIPLRINGVWYNWWKLQTGEQLSMSEMDRRDRDRAKQRVAELAGGWVGMRLLLVSEASRVRVVTANGNFFGMVSRSSQEALNGRSECTVHSAIVRDGNVLAVVS